MIPQNFNKMCGSKKALKKPQEFKFYAWAGDVTNS